MLDTVSERWDKDVVRLEAALDALLHTHPPRTCEPGAFLSAQYAAGLAWVHFPEGLGGLGVSPSLQAVVDKRVQAAGAAPRAREDSLGYRMGGPTIMRHGTLAQQQRYLPPAFCKQERWCQLFSEPGSGSDLASLSTRARRHQDGWIVKGQKVWSSFAREAQLGMLLARTDPDLPKREGITFFVLDMRSPGIDIRPLRQITGESEFNETFLDSVFIPDSCRIGPEGAGWRIAQTTLGSERGSYASRGFDTAAKGTSIGMALDLCRGNAALPQELRDRTIGLWIDSLMLGWTNQRMMRDDPHDVVPAPVTKLSFAKVQQQGYELCMDLMGRNALVGGDADMSGRLFPDEDARHGFLRSRANSIEGGTSEVMRNILAGRVLGLPADEREDNKLPWSKLPRS